MKITDRYARAVRASNLKQSAEVCGNAVDVLGAAGLAGKREPLAMALLRLLVGDGHAAGEIVRILADKAVGKAWHSDRVELDRLEAEDLARAVLGWYRHGTCTECGGHGYLLISGTRSLSENACPACRGTGKRPFDTQFPIERLGVARWLLAEVEREAAKAGPAAMAKLSESVVL